MVEEASSDPSERRGVLLGRWLGKAGRSITRYCLVSRNSRTTNKGGLFLKRRGRFFASRRGFLHINKTPSLFSNIGLHSPLHSERGWG